MLEPQVVPHPPQFSGSVAVSVQAPEQIAPPSPQSRHTPVFGSQLMQTPFLQDWKKLQRLLQVPQFAGS
jgi:hypothetical protein